MKIITAIGNKELNIKLKNINGFILYKNDLQYREAIIEVLKEKNDFDLIIIYEKLPGEISIENLIKEIKIINSEIKIIFILENKNEKLEKILFKENIKNIFYNNEINSLEFINKIKNINLSEEEILKNEIKKLNKIIYEKNNELIKYKNIKLINYNKFNLKRNKKIKNNNLNNYNKINNTEIKNKKIKIKLIKKNNLIKNKINNSEKNNFNKILIITEIDIDIFKQIKKELKNKLINFKIDYLNINKLNKKIKYAGNIVFMINSDFEEIKKYKKLINLIKIKYLIKDKKINILFIENKYNLINLNILKNIFKNYNILGKIKIK